MESSQRGRTALLTTLGVLVALAVVAIAARGSTSAGDATTRSPSDALLDVLFTIYLLGLISGAAIFIYLLVQYRQGCSPNRPRQAPEPVADAPVGRLSRRRRDALRPENRHLAAPATDRPEGGDRTVSAQLRSHVEHAPRDTKPESRGRRSLITLALVVLAVGAGWFAGRARRRARGARRGTTCSRQTRRRRWTSPSTTCGQSPIHAAP